MHSARKSAKNGDGHFTEGGKIYHHISKNERRLSNQRRNYAKSPENNYTHPEHFQENEEADLLPKTPTTKFESDVFELRSCVNRNLNKKTGSIEICLASA